MRSPAELRYGVPELEFSEIATCDHKDSIGQELMEWARIQEELRNRESKKREEVV